MTRPTWMLVALLALGCSGAGTESAPPASEPASAEEGSDKKPAGSAAKMDDAAVTPVAFNVTGAPVVEFSTPKMHCEFCAAKIVTALRETPGVVDVKADAESKMVSVAVTSTGFDNQAALDAIAEAGFGEDAAVVTPDNG